MALEEKRKEKVEITHDMLIGDIIQAKPESINKFLQVGMGCIACPSSLYETLDEACMVHGLDPDYMLELLNN
ncbi:DUF1858 domain-containing protein [Anaerococcus sp. AGMB00486]|uniref:DUF1858 domain-containing protein n=2 Tax=Anaerococcus TaxID=165779 RepID=A0ABX2NC09_9FIRM|nr:MULTISPECIES: DUF1858 domain-containing protein [Anaerococcus]MSS77793.1 DUF1858 domain-containing protein [Anaerococcus porci]NVF12227.1 DUF1858 domain-containing protein [Anaerococcus faecalis]